MIEYKATDLPGKIAYEKPFNVKIRCITPVEQKYILSLSRKTFGMIKERWIGRTRFTAATTSIPTTQWVSAWRTRSSASAQPITVWTTTALCTALISTVTTLRSNSKHSL